MGLSYAALPEVLADGHAQVTAEQRGRGARMKVHGRGHVCDGHGSRKFVEMNDAIVVAASWDRVGALALPTVDARSSQACASRRAACVSTDDDPMSRCHALHRRLQCGWRIEGATRRPRSMPPVNVVGRFQVRTSTRGTVSQATVIAFFVVDDPVWEPGPEHRARPVREQVASAGMLEHRGAVQRQDQLDVVVPMRTGHRRPQGQATGKPEDLVQRRRWTFTRGSGKNWRALTAVCPDNAESRLPG